MVIIMRDTISKTNVMRILDQKKVKYIVHSYVDTDAISGIAVANVLKQDPRQVFKTLVTVGDSGNNYVFLVPVSNELDMKKASVVVSEKKISMVSFKDLFSCPSRSSADLLLPEELPLYLRRL